MSDKVPFSEILVYLDGSESSMSACMYAILLARSTGSRLHAVYCINTKALGDHLSPLEIPKEEPGLSRMAAIIDQHAIIATVTVFLAIGQRLLGPLTEVGRLGTAYRHTDDNAQEKEGAHAQDNPPLCQQPIHARECAFP